MGVGERIRWGERQLTYKVRVAAAGRVKGGTLSGRGVGVKRGKAG